MLLVCDRPHALRPGACFRRGNRRLSRLKVAITSALGLHPSRLNPRLLIRSLASPVLCRIPWGGRADASGRVALRATACVCTTCSVVAPPAGQVALLRAMDNRIGKSRDRCRAVPGVPLLASGTPHGAQ
jgi:hypothetical protein